MLLRICSDLLQLLELGRHRDGQVPSHFGYTLTRLFEFEKVESGIIET